MARWRITYDVTEARGTQEYIVEAESQQEAVEKAKAGEGTLDYEEVCVHRVELISVEEQDR